MSERHAQLPQSGLRIPLSLFREVSAGSAGEQARGRVSLENASYFYAKTAISYFYFVYKFGNHLVI